MRYNMELKRKIISEMKNNNLTIEEISNKYDLNPNIITFWKIEIFFRENVIMINGSIIVLCGIICFLSGCFIEKSKNIEKNNYKQHKNVQTFHYKNFVKVWNNSLLKNEYFATVDVKKVLLPNTNDKEVIQKLSQIFSPKRIENQIKYYKSILTKNEMLNIPIHMYIKFLNSLKFKKNAFKTSMKKSEIIKMILFMMNSKSPSLNIKTLKKLIWTYTFKKYFNDNLEKFYKKGFTKNIASYQKYLEVLKISKEK